MKAGRNKIKSDDTIIKHNDTKIITENPVSSGNRNSNSVIISLLPLLSMLVAILPGILLKNDGIEIAKTGVLTLVLTSATTFYIKLNADRILTKKYVKTIITLAYLCSIGLLFLVPNPEILSFWMLGGLIVAMLIDNKLGLLLHFTLSFILGLSISLRPEAMILLLMIGVLMNLLANALKQKTSVIYAMIIILSSNVTLAFVINNFILETDLAYNYLNSLFSIFAVLIAAYILAGIYGTSEEAAPEVKASTITISAVSIAAEADKEQLQEKTVQEPDTTESDEEEIPESIRNLGLRTSYEVLCDYNNDLLQRLRKQSEPLFEHAVRISDLSGRAAKEVGADDLLARTGGLYHEIGKINGKNYIEEGILIAEEYAFPKELKAILIEHNIKYEKPSSIEAAIVMLSDSVVSTIEYIEKTDEHKFTPNKIIDNIFQLRMEKGSFDRFNLSLKNYKLLKDFFQKEFNKKDNEI